MATLLDRIKRIEDARKVARSRLEGRVLDQVSRAARLTFMLGSADPLGPATPANRRACRAFELVALAQARQAADATL